MKDIYIAYFRPVEISIVICIARAVMFECICLRFEVVVHNDNCARDPVKLESFY